MKQQIFIARIRQNGRVVIPYETRLDLDLQQGDSVTIIISKTIEPKNYIEQAKEYYNRLETKTHE